MSVVHEAISPDAALPYIADPGFRQQQLAVRTDGAPFGSVELTSIICSQADALGERFEVDIDAEEGFRKTTFEPYQVAEDIHGFYQGYSSVMRSLIMEIDLGYKDEARIGYVLPIVAKPSMAVMSVIKFMPRQSAKGRRLGKQGRGSHKYTSNDYYERPEITQRIHGMSASGYASRGRLGTR